MTGLSVSLIGSFRRHYAEVLRCAAEFERGGIEVRSPAQSHIINPGAEYPRFASDSGHLTDLQIQAAALARILSSDVVYVVAPGGYVGRATAYELGCLHDRAIPVYFSEAPLDIPIVIDADQVMTPAAVIRRLSRSAEERVGR